MLTAHVALNVKNLNRSIEFYQGMHGFHLEFQEASPGRALLLFENHEISLFEDPHFKGYDSRSLGAFHLGFQVDRKEKVDELYQKALKCGYRIKSPPFPRDDGDYALFLLDPDGMHVEFFFGNHIVPKKRYRRKMTNE